MRGIGRVLAAVRCSLSSQLCQICLYSNRLEPKDSNLKQPILLDMTAIESLHSKCGRLDLQRGNVSDVDVFTCAMPVDQNAAGVLYIPPAIVRGSCVRRKARCQNRDAWKLNPPVTCRRCSLGFRALTAPSMSQGDGLRARPTLPRMPRSAKPANGFCTAFWRGRSPSRCAIICMTLTHEVPGLALLETLMLLRSSRG